MTQLGNLESVMSEQGLGGVLSFIYLYFYPAFHS